MGAVEKEWKGSDRRGKDRTKLENNRSYYIFWNRDEHSQIMRTFPVHPIYLLVKQIDNRLSWYLLLLFLFMGQAFLNKGVSLASHFCSDYMAGQAFTATDRRTGKTVPLDPSTSPLDLLQNDQLVVTKVKSDPVSYARLLAEYNNSGKKWTDPDFPPDASSVGDAELSYVPKWDRIPQVIENAQFKVGRFQPSDILQGGLGDCYLLSAIAALSEKEQRIIKLFPDTENHHDTGIYMVRMQHGGIMQEVVVDDFIPLTPSGQPAFVQPRRNEFWPLIMQKAWAKLNGSYANIIGGLPHQVLNSLTEAPAIYHRLYEPKDIDQQTQMNSIWNDLLKGTSQGWCFCTGTEADNAIQSKGLVPGHAYTLLGAYEIQRGSRTERLVKLRNPWGKYEWNGRCHDRDSDFWNGVSSIEKNKMGMLNKDNGIFFMGWQDFLKYYNMVDICMINEKFSYNFQSFQSSRKNGHFFQIDVKKSGRAYFGLHQEDNRAEPEYIKNLGYARSTIVLGKIVGDNLYDWVEGVMGSSFCDQYLQANLESGSYLAYVKHDWVKSEKGLSTFSLYFENNALLKEVSQHKDFLHKVYLDYANKTTENKQSLGTDEWLFVKLLYEKGGFGVIAAKAQSCKLKISGREQDFNSNGFVLKKPHKGEGTVQETIDRGETKIILARSAREFKASRIRFPPEIDVQRLME